MKWTIIETYQYFQIKSVFFTVNNELIEKQSKEGWAKGVWTARSVYCNDNRVRKVLAMRVIMWSTTETNFTKKMSQYSTTSIFTVLQVCLLRTQTNTRINQSSIYATMMQQTTTTTTMKWTIIETYQYFQIKSVFFTVNNELIEKQSTKERWGKGVWIARRSFEWKMMIEWERCSRQVWVIMWSTSEIFFCTQQNRVSTRVPVFLLYYRCSKLRTQTNTRINQSSIDATMMQQTTTTTMKLIII